MASCEHDRRRLFAPGGIRAQLAQAFARSPKMMDQCSIAEQNARVSRSPRSPATTERCPRFWFDEHDRFHSLS